MKSSHFWNWVRDETESESRTLYLNGVIAEESWFSDEVTPAAFKADLTSGSGPITVWINSVGGDCVAAAQIYNMLMEYQHDVTVKIDGIAASAKDFRSGLNSLGVRCDDQRLTVSHFNVSSSEAVCE